jgi:pimeloyl-ACP methyl ester carboxylesterase
MKLPSTPRMNRTPPWPMTPQPQTHQARCVLTNCCCCMGSRAPAPTGSRWPDGCRPSCTPSRLTGQDTAPARGQPPGSPPERTRCSKSWTPAASSAIWGHASSEHGPLWRTFLAEQRALLRELDGLVSAVPMVQAPVLLIADPSDTLVPVDTARRLAQALPDARLQLVEGPGHHLPRRAPDVVAKAVVAFMAAVEAPGRPG